MTMTITSTDMFTNVRGVTCRVWRGVTAAGVKCDLAIPLLRVSHDEHESQFQAQLRELSDLEEGRVVSMRHVW